MYVLSPEERRGYLVEEILETPAALAGQEAGVLPGVVGVREQNRNATNLGLDTCDGCALFRNTGACLTVASAGAGGPACLEVDGVLAGAEVVGELELGFDQRAGILGYGIGVEEGVEVDTRDVDDVAPDAEVLLPDVEGIGSGDKALVSLALEGGFAR